MRSLEPESEIILYGSRARGDEREDSDWDLLILVPYPADLKEEQRFWHKLFDLELQFGQAISTLVKSKMNGIIFHRYVVSFVSNVKSLEVS